MGPVIAGGTPAPLLPYLRLETVRMKRRLSADSLTGRVRLDPFAALSTLLGIFNE